MFYLNNDDIDKSCKIIAGEMLNIESSRLAFQDGIYKGNVSEKPDYPRYTENGDECIMSKTTHGRIYVTRGIDLRSFLITLNKYLIEHENRNKFHITDLYFPMYSFNNSMEIMIKLKSDKYYNNRIFKCNDDKPNVERKFVWNITTNRFNCKINSEIATSIIYDHSNIYDIKDNNCDFKYYKQCMDYKFNMFEGDFSISIALSKYWRTMIQDIEFTGERNKVKLSSLEYRGGDFDYCFRCESTLFGDENAIIDKYCLCWNCFSYWVTNEQLRKIDHVYRYTSNMSVMDMIDKNDYTGDIRKLLIAINKCTKNINDYKYILEFNDGMEFTIKKYDANNIKPPVNKVKENIRPAPAPARRPVRRPLYESGSEDSGSEEEREDITDDDRSEGDDVPEEDKPFDDPVDIKDDEEMDDEIRLAIEENNRINNFSDREIPGKDIAMEVLTKINDGPVEDVLGCDMMISLERIAKLEENKFDPKEIIFYMVEDEGQTYISVSKNQWDLMTLDVVNKSPFNKAKFFDINVVIPH